jgi:hypothetical protein
MHRGWLTVLVYTFDYETGIYAGPLQLTAADVDPRGNRWLIPGNATAIQPPLCDIKTMPVWRNDRWEVVECIAEIPDELLARCRAGMEQLQAMRWPNTEKLK